ncbi:ATP-dependent DNA helicase RecQ [Pelagirhabdus alkalitolerans]|uniref:ATP-dependent DNA helicase RecQ n=1 Tax=Pelagirhabdus alkalitolerans TaxID=1612202 RepID=A0A1G6HB63_9BACI|nr:ATP-dependent DNA helicase RecQ [Pelagirhabdus alkalitolerans]SDB91529.1 ATP-dependent DNA helicase RecQ [Pelagirhabdus alkalitolerans]
MTIDQLLQNKFQYSSFREGQRDIIEDVIAGKHVLATLPTGAGKSICYQLPSFVLEGTVIVVTPLISLMEDQVKRLISKGIKRSVALNSFNSRAERRDILLNLNVYQLIYISPELLQSDEIMNRFKQLNVSLFVIDEAHCMSQWGHEFRPDYLKLNEVHKALNEPTILALTATATEDVQSDIIRHFHPLSFQKHLYPIDRENIALTIKHVENTHEKDQELLTLFEEFRSPAMIYFSSRKEAERVARLLRDSSDHLNIAYYHGGLDHEDRLLIQQQFMHHQLDVICCTSAFGMGIDKPDVRVVIHYHLPTQIESFIQEIGRAGRDQLESVSITLVSPTDYHIPKRLIDSELPSIDMLEQILTFIKAQKDNEEQVLQDVFEVLFDLTEVQYRFVINFLKEKSVISTDMVLKPTNLTPLIEQELITKVKDRYQYKEGKINELFNWVHRKGCLRNHLYQKFQTTIKQPLFQCCDRCDKNFYVWTSDERRKSVSSDWEDHLMQIMQPHI